MRWWIKKIVNEPLDTYVTVTPFARKVGKQCLSCGRKIANEGVEYAARNLLATVFITRKSN